MILNVKFIYYPVMCGSAVIVGNNITMLFTLILVKRSRKCVLGFILLIHKNSNKMDKIAKIALTAKLGLQDETAIDNIIKVMNATGNPEVALEMLLDVYEERKLPLQPETRSNVFSKERTSITFKSYDPFKDQIEYTYFLKLKKYIYTSKTDSNQVIEIIDKERDGYNYLFRKHHQNLDIKDFNVETIHLDQVYESKFSTTCSSASWLNKR